MMFGPGKMDFTNADVKTMLTMATGMPETRLKVVGDLPKTLYNLHVNAPNAQKKELDEAIEMAIVSASGLKVEHKTTNTEAYVLTPLPEYKMVPAPGLHGGFAFYDDKKHLLKCVSATADQLAGALESAVGKPVINESGLDVSVSADISLAANDVAAANAALAKELQLTLKPAMRPVETVVLTAPAASGAAATARATIK